VMAEGSVVTSGPATPAAFAAGRRWRCTAVVRGAAERAAATLVGSGVEARAADVDTVAFALEAGQTAVGPAVAILAAAGIEVERAGFDPPWPAQLIG